MKKAAPETRSSFLYVYSMMNSKIQHFPISKDKISFQYCYKICASGG